VVALLHVVARAPSLVHRSVHAALGPLPPHTAPASPPLYLTPPLPHTPRNENGKAFEELVLDEVIAGARAPAGGWDWRLLGLRGVGAVWWLETRAVSAERCC